MILGIQRVQRNDVPLRRAEDTLVVVDDDDVADRGAVVEQAGSKINETFAVLHSLYRCRRVIILLQDLVGMEGVAQVGHFVADAVKAVAQLHEHRMHERRRFLLRHPLCAAVKHRRQNHHRQHRAGRQQRHLAAQRTEMLAHMSAHTPFLMRCAVRARRLPEICFEGGGKVVIVAVPRLPRDFGDAHGRRDNQRLRALHAVAG